jgi:hypothetical protein
MSCEGKHAGSIHAEAESARIYECTTRTASGGLQPAGKRSVNNQEGGKRGHTSRRWEPRCGRPACRLRAGRPARSRDAIASTGASRWSRPVRAQATYGQHGKTKSRLKPFSAAKLVEAPGIEPGAVVLDIRRLIHPMQIGPTPARFTPPESYSPHLQLLQEKFAS